MIEKACNKTPKHLKSLENTDGQPKPSINEDLKMLVVHSLMTKGLQKYIENVAKDRKELARREEKIQDELDKAENSITNIILTCVETVLLKLSKLKALALQPEKYKIIGLDINLIEAAIDKFYKLYQKYEELNLVVIEAKLDIKNFFCFLNKYAIKFEGINQTEENQNTYNPLNKYVVDYDRLIKFIEDKNEQFRLENCMKLLETSKKGHVVVDQENSKPIQTQFLDKLSDVYDKKESSSDDATANQKIDHLKNQAKDLVNQIYELPRACISRYIRPVQVTQLCSSDQGHVLDMYVNSSVVNNNSNTTNEEGDSKATFTKNLGDSEGVVSDVLIAIKYQLIDSVLLCIYFQKVEKKLDPDAIPVNFACTTLPRGTDIIEASFSNYGQLIMTLTDPR